jgi:FAD-dependent urate hydroxylase
VRYPPNPGPVVVNRGVSLVDVLIAGAGLGGLALAGGLLADGHRVRLLEQAPSLRGGGAAVTIFSNGAAALSGLGAPLEGIGGVIDELELRAADGANLFRVDLRVLRQRTGFPVVTVPRDRLITHLAQGLPANAVQFDRAVESVTVYADRVDAIDNRGYFSSVTRDCAVSCPRATGYCNGGSTYPHLLPTQPGSPC